MNILHEADKIINERSEEKEREYGPFIQCNERAAKIASVLCNKEITTLDIYNFQIALKLARESHSHKEDNLLDLAAYVGALNNFHNGVEPEVWSPEFSIPFASVSDLETWVKENPNIGFMRREPLNEKRGSWKLYYKVKK